MTKVSDGSIVGEGLESDYKTPNTEYDESLCLTNNSGDYSFTINDGYGDGLSQSETAHYYGFLDNIEIFTGRAERWYSETTTFPATVPSTPPSTSPTIVPTDPPSKAPTQVPTISCASDEIPFRLELLLDNFSE